MNNNLPIENYFSAISFRLKLLDKSTAHYEKYVAERFSIFDYVNMNENKISEIIADLLNSKGKHSQGSLFINKFIDLIGLKDLVPAGITPKIRLEVPTSRILSDKRRIDILIKYDDKFAIMIENKPWAKDQINQINDYCEHLRKDYNNNFFVVYLSNKPISAESITKENLQLLKSEKKYKELTYSKDLPNWLLDCSKDCKSEKVRWFLIDFQIFSNNIN